MKYIVAGSRNFNNYELLDKTLKELGVTPLDEIICGEARGADTLGKIWGQHHQVPVRSFPADWDKHGRAAGYIRNRQMGEYADFLVAFWDGRSNGTKWMIEIMKEMGKHGKVVIYET